MLWSVIADVLLKEETVNKLVLSAIGSLALFVSLTGVASADQTGDSNAFICPVAGEGVLNSPKLDAHTLPGGGATFLPGNEQAGGHANVNGLNENGTPSATNKPGADGFTPIWNPAG
jgi:hypothetical protein